MQLRAATLTTTPHPLWPLNVFSKDPSQRYSIRNAPLLFNSNSEWIMGKIPEIKFILTYKLNFGYFTFREKLAHLYNL